MHRASSLDEEKGTPISRSCSKCPLLSVYGRSTRAARLQQIPFTAWHTHPRPGSFFGWHPGGSRWAVGEGFPAAAFVQALGVQLFLGAQGYRLCPCLAFRVWRRCWYWFLGCGFLGKVNIGHPVGYYLRVLTHNMGGLR